MTNDDLIPSLRSMLASLDVAGGAGAGGRGASGGLTASTTDLLDSMDISALLQQMDSAQGALDLLETRTDSLMQKIDSLLDEHAAEEDDDDARRLGEVEEVEEGTAALPPSTAPAPAPSSSSNRKGTSVAFADDTKTSEPAASIPPPLSEAQSEEANR
ncbi:hypothetical protein HDU87_004218 [Geranomyces variabilis]|uniref:Uncharacterized protein n=1 Tax=Geranomyces variabilis TaxID=109894 RepID=A0AAD5TLH1_9FUNG|nr:hypothetical protein HDU87_004218 [Geranomyces variabilis]